jgi:hypothetical protein
VLVDRRSACQPWNGSDVAHWHALAFVLGGFLLVYELVVQQRSALVFRIVLRRDIVFRD